MYSTSEVTARRERLGFVSAKPVVRAPIPPKTYAKRPKDFIRIETPAPEVSEKVVQPRPVTQWREEAAITPLHRIAAERWKDVLRETAEAHGITVTALKSRRRAKEIVLARQEACFRLVTELGLSYPATARRVNYFDHTTAMYAAKKHAERHGLSINRRIETGEDKLIRDTAIVRGALLGRTVSELADLYDLSEGRIKDIIREQRAALEAMNAQ